MALNLQDINIPVIAKSNIVIDESIGRGGFGTVYRGQHAEYGLVAVKALLADGGQIPKRDLKILESEGKKLRAYGHHKSVVTLLGLIAEQDNFSLVLEYMCFGSVADFRKKFKPGFPLLIQIVRDIIHGMDFLHSQDPAVLHLDLKADNILISKNIDAKIADFGLAQLKSVTQALTRKSGEGPCCTVTHVPPEVWFDINLKRDKSFDVYSFGIVIWEILSGLFPFGNTSCDMIRTVVKDGQRPDLSKLPDNTPQQLRDQMTRCWSQQPGQRPSFTQLNAEVEPLYQARVLEIPSNKKAIRRQICEEYSANDPEYIETNHLDDIEVPIIPETVYANSPSSHPFTATNDDETVIQIGQSEPGSNNHTKTSNESMELRNANDEEDFYSDSLSVDGFPETPKSINQFSASYVNNSTLSMSAMNDCISTPRSPANASTLSNVSINQKTPIIKPLSSHAPNSPPSSANKVKQSSAPTVLQSTPPAAAERQQSMEQNLATDAFGGSDSKTQPLSASAKTSIRSLTHCHTTGEVTRIRFGEGQTPNLQVGSHNVMVVNDIGYANDVESKPKPKTSTKLKLTDSTSSVTPDDFDIVSAEIGKDWRRLGRALNIMDSILDQVHMDYNISGNYEVMYQILNKWVQREARNATKRWLAEKLHEIERDDIAKDIK